MRHGLALLVAARELTAHERVWSLDLVTDRLADVVQERCSPRGLGARSELSGHHRRQPRHLDRVGEHVLTVAGAELEPAQELDQLGVNGVDVGLEQGLLTLLDDVVIDLRLGLVVGLLDAGRLDAPVHEQLLERELRDLATNAVEG